MAKRTRGSEASDIAADTPAQSGRSRSSARLDPSDPFRTQTEPAEPSEEAIRLRAYQRYLERGGGDGRDFEDWLEAERELRGHN
jgi:hypothetical protein